MQEHARADDVPRTLRLDQRVSLALVEQIGGDEVVLEGAGVAEQLVTDLLKVGIEVRAIEVSRRYSVMDELAKVLAETCAQVQEPLG